MKQADAKNQIVALWAKRDRTRLTRLDILAFHHELQKNHPNLLKFNYYGPDKYQIIRAWLEPYVVEPH